jgi:hypothetical protein
MVLLNVLTGQWAELQVVQKNTELPKGDSKDFFYYFIITYLNKIHQ